MPDNHGYERRLSNERTRVMESDLPGRDRDVLLRYLREVDSQLDLSPATITNRVKDVRIPLEWTSTPLSEIETMDDVNTMLFALKHDHDLNDGTLRNYQKALRLFFDWRGDTWADDIRVGASPSRPVSEDDVLSSSEVDAIVDACSSTRDKAFVAFMLDTGFRIGAVVSLRLEDIDVTQQPATVSFNEEGPVKGASGTVLVTWSHNYVGNWLDIHAERDNPGAPLFYRRDSRSADSDGFLSYQAARNIIATSAADAGLEGVTPHTLRRTAISQWINDRLTESEIKHRAGWHKDSSQFSQYDGLTDADMNNQIAEHYGITNTEDGAEPVVSECPWCKTPVRSGGRYCSGCARPLTQSAAAVSERTDEQGRESLATVGPDEAGEILEFWELLNESPSVREDLAMLSPTHDDSPDSPSSSSSRSS